MNIQGAGMPSQAPLQSTTLDDLLPAFETYMAEAIGIACPPKTTYAAIQRLRMSDMPLAQLLGMTRSLPLLVRDLVQQLRGKMPIRLVMAEKPFLEQMTESGPWVPLVEDINHEIVSGLIGQFWTKDFGFRGMRSRIEFTAFNEPEYAKVVTNFRVEPAPGGSVLISETRVHCTSPDAARKFSRYWLVIRPGAHLTVRSMLKAVKRRAERAPESDHW